MDAMPWLFSDLDMELMEKIKHVFNQNELCNPGKIFPTAKRCWETAHGPKMVRAASRGAAV
jgi:glycolate oxidase